MAYTPFFQGTDATNVINDYLNQNVNANTPMVQPDMNQYGVFRNPYSPEGFYANETDQYPISEYVPPVADDEGVPACPEGYVYDEVMKSCRYVGYSTETEQGGNREDPEERPYMSIEDMKNATDEDLLDYLTSGFLGNSLLGYLPSKGTQVTLKTLPPNVLSYGLSLLGLNDSKLRKDFIMNELMKRGYFTGQFDKNKNPIFDIANKNVNTNVGGIESALPQNVQGQPVTDVYGDTYQQIANNQGNTGYTFTSGNPQDAVGQTTQSGVVYGPGRGTSGPSFTGSFNPYINQEDDYDDESSGI